MISLNNYIKQINQFFTENKNGNVLKSYDLVFPAKRNEENLNIDIDGNEVFYDDAYDVFLYHRQTNEDINELSGRGRGQLYNIVYTVEMVVFTKDSSFQDFATVILKKVPKLRLVSVTNPSQSYDIVNQETGLTDFGFDTTKVFKIVYTLTVMSEECFTVDGIQCHSIGTFPIKVIQGAKGDKGDPGSGGGGGLTCDDLSNCQTIIDLNNNKVDKEVGKGLSTNDLTNTLKSNYDTAYSQTHTHANKTTLDAIQEALTTVLKSAYDSAVSWISTNGTNILNHISSVSNPHQTKCLLFVQHSSTNPVDSETRYFSNRQILPQLSESTNRIYFSHSQTIKGANIQLYSATAGTNEAWSLYVRLNNTTDYLIATLSQSSSIRNFENNSLNINLVSGDFITIKSVQPIWATNPVGTTGAGNLSIIL